MDRRSVLKSLGLAAGATVATPTIFSVLSSCTADRSAWKLVDLVNKSNNFESNEARQQF